MVENRKVIENLKPLMEQMHSADMDVVDETPPFVQFFISFDIVSSTAYKNTHKRIWASTMREILRHIISTFETSPMGGYGFWKILGDEVIYTKTVVRVSDLPVMLSEINAKMAYLNQLIADGVICDKEAGQILGIKGAAWICDVSSSVAYTRNVVTQYSIKDNRKQQDFSGPDIDTGFRAAKYSVKNRLQITWALAYLLNKVLSPEEMAYHVHIISFKVLEGVWAGRPYPIILYHSDKDVSFDESIVGCVSFKERQLQAYLEEKHFQKLPEDSPYASYAQKVVEELCQEMDLHDRIQNVLDIIGRYQTVHYNRVRLVDKVKCTLICYALENGEPSFMLAKKKFEKDWKLVDFPLYLRQGMMLFYEIADYYRDELGVKVRILQDPTHYMETPVIVEKKEIQTEGGETIHTAVILGEITYGAGKDTWRYDFQMLPASQIQTADFITAETKDVLERAVAVLEENHVTT